MEVFYCVSDGGNSGDRSFICIIRVAKQWPQSGRMLQWGREEIFSTNERAGRRTRKLDARSVRRCEAHRGDISLFSTKHTVDGLS